MAYSTGDKNINENKDISEKKYLVCRQKLEYEELLTTFVLEVHVIMTLLQRSDEKEVLGRTNRVLSFDTTRAA
jgi:hypothetical protein